MHNTSFFIGVIRMKISTEYLDGRLTVYLAGELDHHGARETVESISEAIDAKLPRDLTLDMSHLGFMEIGRAHV